MSGEICAIHEDHLTKSVGYDQHTTCEVCRLERELAGVREVLKDVKAAASTVYQDGRRPIDAITDIERALENWQEGGE